MKSLFYIINKNKNPINFGRKKEKMKTTSIAATIAALGTAKAFEQGLTLKTLEKLTQTKK